MPISELCEVSVANSIKLGLFTPSVYQQANALCANMDLAFRRKLVLILKIIQNSPKILSILKKYFLLK